MTLYYMVKDLFQLGLWEVILNIRLRIYKKYINMIRFICFTSQKIEALISTLQKNFNCYMLFVNVFFLVLPFVFLNCKCTFKYSILWFRSWFLFCQSYINYIPILSSWKLLLCYVTYMYIEQKFPIF